MTTAMVDITSSALHNQCPNLSIVGFGPDCGNVTYPNSGIIGIIKVNGLNLSCEDAQELIEAHISEGLQASMAAVPISSPTSGFYCRTENLTFAGYVPYYTSCFPLHQDGHVYVIPTDHP